MWSDYHFDMNVQVAAWPLWAANHEEEFISLLRMLEENLPSLREAVPPAYQDDCGAMICEWESETTHTQRRLGLRER